jgi:uncharacterized membrane protein
MKHFFYAVYVLFYTGAVFLGGMFVGQFLERARRAARRKQMVSQPGASGGLRDRKVAVMRKRE